MDVDAELADLLAQGERAAFHGRPAGGVGALQRAFELSRDAGRGTEATAAAWLLGVCLGAAGRFGSALAVLEPMATTQADDPAERRLFAALADASIASIRRQLGHHEAARGWDELGLSLTDGNGEAAFDCVLGLAADAVGLGDPVTARRQLELATEMAVGHDGWWRQRVRLAWVTSEISMLEGDPERAETAAAGAVQGAEAAGAPRHVAKSLLFVGVAQVQAGRLAEAESTLRRAATLAESLGALPLLWPARAVLGALVQDSAPAEASRSLAAARSAVIAIADDLPEALRTAWLDQDSVAALLGG